MYLHSDLIALASVVIVAMGMKTTFPAILFGLMIKIGGGALAKEYTLDLGIF